MNFLLQNEVVPVEKKDFWEAWEAWEDLYSGKVKAIVYDKPVLQYYKSKASNVVVLNNIYEEQDYGVAFKEGSPLKEFVNVRLLQLKENGTYKKVYNKYFNSKGE